MKIVFIWRNLINSIKQVAVALKALKLAGLVDVDEPYEMVMNDEDMLLTDFYHLGYDEKAG